jgi:hypothetical protein
MATITGTSGIPPINLEVSGYEGILDVFNSLRARFDYNISESPSPKKEDDEEENLPIIPIFAFLVVAGGVFLATRR